MMVQRRHAEDAAAGELETGDLDDDRDGFEDEEAADNDQDQFVLGDEADRAQGPADRQRSGVTHEHHRGWRVEPQKSEAGADQGGAENRQLAGAGYMMNLQIV